MEFVGARRRHPRLSRQGDALGSTPKGRPQPRGADPCLLIRDTTEGASSISRGGGLARCRGFGTRRRVVVGRTRTRTTANPPPHSTQASHAILSCGRQGRGPPVPLEELPRRLSARQAEDSDDVEPPPAFDSGISRDTVMQTPGQGDVAPPIELPHIAPAPPKADSDDPEPAANRATGSREGWHSRAGHNRHVARSTPPDHAG